MMPQVLPPTQIPQQYESYEDSHYFSATGQLTTVMLISTEQPQNVKVVRLPTILLVREYKQVQDKCHNMNNMARNITEEILDLALRQDEPRQFIKGKN